MPVRAPHRPVPAIALAAAIFAAASAPALGQAVFADAFPGTRFSKPVYFGAFPGGLKTNVVLEQHKGIALLVHRGAQGWVKDTLLRLEVHQANEMGLLGIAFHPEFNSNRKYYISYDPPGDLYNIVEERLADATGRKDSGAQGRVLIKIADPYANHNGGTIAFGPKDGLLYIGTGDGGSGNDPEGNGQNLNALLGKMLRIDVDRRDAGLPYGIPAGNPFINGGGRAEIFAYGLRNPWKWSFDPLTGDLWAGDVGQVAFEEVDLIVAGGNYGWKIMEGPKGTQAAGFIPPVFSYDRDAGNCVTGGVVFRGNPRSRYYGAYFAADYGSRALWSLTKNGTGPATATKLEDTPADISSFGTDAQGRIYACGHDNGIIYALAGPELAPAPSVRPQGSLLGKYRRIWQVRAGGRLQGRAFSKAPVLVVSNLEGRPLGILRASDPVLPADMDAGAYLLKPAQGKGLPDLLTVP